MAGSSIVGILKVLLTAETGDFSSGLKGAAQQTKTFTGQITAMGTQLGSISKLMGGLFAGVGISTITAAISKVADYAGKISDLSKQTGLSTDAIQQMSFVAKQTGTSLESFSNAALKLGTNLAGGSTSVQAAVDKLGLSYQHLKTLQPDQQFELVAAALQKIEQPQERNRLAIELFGRTAKNILPAIAQGYADIAAQAVLAGNKQIEAIDKAADAWDRLKTNISAASVQGVGSAILTYEQLGTGIDTLTDKERAHLAFLKKSGGDWQSYLDELATKHIALRLEQERVALQTKRQTQVFGELQALDIPKDIGVFELEYRKLEKTLAKAIAKQEEMNRAAERFAESVRRIDTADAYEPFRAAIPQATIETGLLWADTLAEVGQATTDAEKEALDWANTNGAVLAPSIRAVSSHAEDSTDKIRTWGETLGDALLQVPRLIQDAFTGGGGLGGAFKGIASMFGSAGLGKLFEKNGLIGKHLQGLSKLFGDSFVPALGQALGALIGPAISALKKLFGIGINDEIKKFNKQIADSQQKLIATYGSFERIDRLGRAVGVDLAGAWKSQGEAGKLAFDKLAADFEAAVAKMESDLEGFKSDLDDAFDQARDLGYIFDKDGNLVSVSFDKMRDAADEFGVNLEALGPAFQGQRLAADAGKIINAFDLLARGGADAGTILFGMKDEISKLVNDSIKFKTTIPENMRPWIQNLIDTKQLLDENGENIQDIGTIKFAPAIKTQFEEISAKIGSLIDKIAELIEILTERLTPALDEATRDRNVHIGITTDPIPDFTGAGMVPAGFASGTMGKLGDWFGNFKTGMPAMLHGMEAVVTPQQAPAFALDVLGANAGFAASSQQRAGTAQPTIIRNQIENVIKLDGHVMKRWVLEETTTAIENNERGIRSRQRDALGIV